MSGSLGFNRTASNQSSLATSVGDSTSNSYGYSGGNSGDVSQSSSVSNSDSVAGGQSASSQKIAFEDLYKQLYGNASGAASNVAMMAPQLQQAAQQLFTGGSQFLQSLGGNAGTNYQENRLNGSSPVEDIVASMKTDAANLFTDKLNPAITANAVAGGNLGGSRQGIAEGTAQALVANDFTKNAAALRYADVQSKDAIAANISSNSIAAANTGLGSLPGMLDILERGQNAELAPYSSLSSILGGPTTLASSEANNFANSTSNSNAMSAAEAFSRSFGEQFADSQSHQESLATSKGKSRGFGFNSSFSLIGS